MMQQPNRGRPLSEDYERQADELKRLKCKQRRMRYMRKIEENMKKAQPAEESEQQMSPSAKVRDVIYGIRSARRKGPATVPLSKYVRMALLFVSLGDT